MRAISPRICIWVLATLLVGNALVVIGVSACGARSSLIGDTDLPSNERRRHLAAPRPIAPLSTAIVTSQRPRLRWELPAGSDDVRVELCRDRAMTRDCQTIDATGTSAMPANALAPGVWFWRLRKRTGASVESATSPVWQFRVGVRSAEVNTSWGTELDVNGDGYTDLAVGSPRAHERRGRVDVFLGGPGGIAATPHVTLRGAELGNVYFFGTSVASVGDVNGDGFGDLAVGALIEVSSGPRPRAAGMASLYLGGPSGLSATPYQVVHGPSVVDSFEVSLAGVGDVNGDGFGDLVVGVPYAAPGGRTDAGWASVYLGSASGLSTTPHRVLEGAMEQDYFGRSVAGAGDINGDGYADLVVGAPGVDPSGRTDAGVVNVYLGSATGLSTTPHHVLQGATAEECLGSSVASAGDVNGDGYADLVVGAPCADPSGRTDAGVANVYLGSATGLGATPHRVWAGAAERDEFGFSVASAGDVNSDGYADLVVGALFSAPGGRMWSGTATVYLGSASGPGATAHRVLEGAAVGDVFGRSVASAGDVNGDGYADLIVGAHYADPRGRLDAGAASVYLGSASGLSTTPHRVLEGAMERDEFGWSVVGATW